jgi:hypothetical protein
MSKSKEHPVRIECMGGCGKDQMIRPSKIDKSWTFYGCGKCDGYEPALKTWRARIPSGAHVEWTSQAVAGFGGYRMRMTTPEDEAAFARARTIRDAAVAMLKEQGPR